MIRVQAEDFDTGRELDALSQRNHQIGAVCSFVGLVRDMREGADSSGATDQSMTLEHYPGMTERQLEAIEAEAQKRWNLSASLIIHRYGRLKPGDRIVLVAAASPHRHASFEAAAFMMDYLKSKAPFWKLEEQNGQGAWVDARETDEVAMKRWNT